jgi:hypothetical protein
MVHLGDEAQLEACLPTKIDSRKHLLLAIVVCFQVVRPITESMLDLPIASATGDLVQC